MFGRSGLCRYLVEEILNVAYKYHQVFLINIKLRYYVYWKGSCISKLHFKSKFLHKLLPMCPACVRRWILILSLRAVGFLHSYFIIVNSRIYGLINPWLKNLCRELTWGVLLKLHYYKSNLEYPIAIANEVSRAKRRGWPGGSITELMREVVYDTGRIGEKSLGGLLDGK